MRRAWHPTAGPALPRTLGVNIARMPSLAPALSLACLAAVTGLVYSEFQERPGLRVVSKLAASALMVLVAASLGARSTAYGLSVLVALTLSAFGDACLLSERRQWFMAGLALFLSAHIAYSLAFAMQAWAISAFVIALVFASLAGAVTLRWLWNRLNTFYRVAVSAYVIAIAMMCAFAVARGVATSSWLTPLGAIAFAASDISVARDRFVQRSVVNRAWGLPVYYLAQLALAWSVA